MNDIPVKLRNILLEDDVEPEDVTCITSRKYTKMGVSDAGSWVCKKVNDPICLSNMESELDSLR